MKSTKQSAAKSTKQAATFPFRVIVRGTTGTGKNAKRVRRVKTVRTVDEGAAALAVEKDSKLLAGLDNVYLAVFPPLS